MIWIIPFSRENRAVRIALAGGLALLAIAIVARVSRSPLLVVGTNSVEPTAHLVVRKGETSLCQSNEVLPLGTSAMRLWISVNIGPRVTVAALSGSRVIAQGEQSSGWTGAVVTIPIAPVPRRSSEATVCIGLGPLVERIYLVGGQSHQRGGGPSTKMRIEYLRPGGRSWWTKASSVARRMGLDRDPGGAWIALIPLVLMAAATALTALLILGQLGSRSTARPSAPPIAGAQVASPPQAPEPAHTRSARVGRRALHLRSIRETLASLVSPVRPALRRVPRAAWVCASVATLSAASWSIITPPFQVPDEPSHFAYTQQLAETGELPKYNASLYSPEELKALEDLNHKQIRFNPAVGTISSTAQQRKLQHDLALPLARHGVGEAGVATAEPPLYYALQTIPYYLGSGGTLLDQLTLMRLLSALMAGLTALFAFLFLREALPGAPWSWAVGGLGVALFPLLGFISGGMNPDAMLFAVCAALFFCLARAFRRGLTLALAIAIGVVTALGFLTKVNFIGLAPGVALALIVLGFRHVRIVGRSGYRAPAIAAAIAACPVCVYMLANAIHHRPLVGNSTAGVEAFADHGSIGAEASYIWQSYLPRLPGMAHYFPGLDTSRLWFDRSIGLYGWLDTYFPGWVYSVALIPAVVLTILCIRALVQGRAGLRSRIWELLAYAAMAGGLLVLIGVNSYLKYPGLAMDYAEPRYLLPVAALFGATLALAARGAGRAWGPVVGTLIVVLVLGHDIFSQLLLVARYYG
jgi:Predicted membrane protein (DUF2142)